MESNQISMDMDKTKRDNSCSLPVMFYKVLYIVSVLSYIIQGVDGGPRRNYGYQDYYRDGYRNPPPPPPQQNPDHGYSDPLDGAVSYRCYIF